MSREDSLCFRWVQLHKSSTSLSEDSPISKVLRNNDGQTFRMQNRLDSLLKANPSAEAPVQTGLVLHTGYKYFITLLKFSFWLSILYWSNYSLAGFLHPLLTWTYRDKSWIYLDEKYKHKPLWHLIGLYTKHLHMRHITSHSSKDVADVCSLVWRCLWQRIKRTWLYIYIILSNKITLNFCP